MAKSTKEVSEKEYRKIKDSILELFTKNPNKTFNHKQVARQVKQINPSIQTLVDENQFSPSQFKTVIIACINELYKNDELVETEVGKYRKIFAESYVTGKIDISSSGAAYLMNDDYEDDIYISPRNVNNALNGDKVTILLHAKKSGKRLSGEVIEIIERAKTEFVGIMQVSSKFAFLVPDTVKMDVDIFIPLDKLNGAKHGQKAVVKITEWVKEAHNPEGEVVTVLGEPGENETEMHAILVEYGFPLDFPKAVYEETSKIAHKIPASEIKNRRDFRKVCTFTIDPEDAKDFDDAISFEILNNGNYSIGIHIADVTHYIKENTALNKEAVQRATSVYLVDRVIPMLPEKISNEVCSLRPNEDKLCFSAVFEINESAEVLNEWFGRTVIHSTQRFSYQQAQDVIEKKNDTLSKELEVLNTLAQNLRKARFKHGAINFDSVEVKFRLDETGFPTGVYIKEHKESNQLIEEFMLLANRRVAEFVGKKFANDTSEKKKTFVYRIHDVPKTEKLESFASFANKFGYRIITSSHAQISKSMNNLLKEVHGKKEQNVLEKLAIRTMSKAIYSTNNIGHYGLAFDFYTHFTSPIRRYPDMMVHRLLQHYLDEGNSVDATVYEEQCKHSTDLEIMATEAERASIKYMQVMYLEDKKDKVFDGIISGVKDYGIFVELVESKCEGMVRIKNLIDDFYEFDEDNHSLIGRRTKRTFQLGDTLQVVVEQTDLQKRQIDFLLFEDGKKQTGGSYERGSSGVKNKKSKERAKKNTDFRKKQGGKKNKGKKRRS